MLSDKQWDEYRAAARSPFHYWGEDDLKSGATYIIALGGRSIGKSYFYRRTAVEDWYRNGALLGYVRRYAEDVTPTKVLAYFTKIDMAQITGGEYNGIECRGGTINAIHRDDKNKVDARKLMGYYFALSMDEHYKSQDYVPIDYFVFEEVVTSGRYLADEPNRLQNLISTIVRDNDTCVLMIGNTITRACPYFSEWSLTHVPRMQPGDADTYHVGDDTDVRVVMCAPAKDIKKQSSRMFFGKSKKMIVDNQWHSDIYPKCPINPYTDSVVKHFVIFSHANLSMRAELRKSTDGDYFVWVTPIDFRFDDIRKIRVVSDEIISLSPYHQSRFVPLCPAEQFIADARRLGKMYYCDNLTGTDFAALWQALT